MKHKPLAALRAQADELANEIKDRYRLFDAGFLEELEEVLSLRPGWEYSLAAWKSDAKRHGDLWLLETLGLFQSAVDDLHREERRVYSQLMNSNHAGLQRAS